MCLVDAVGVSSGPGRSPAQRVSRLRVGEVLEGFAQRSRCAHNNLLQVILATVRAFTAVSRATLSWRIISTAPSAVFGIAVDWPANTDRAATSASMVSDLPAPAAYVGHPIHFYDPMPRSAHRAGQAGTIAPGTFDAERLDRSVYLGHVIRA